MNFSANCAVQFCTTLAIATKIIQLAFLWSGEPLVNQICGLPGNPGLWFTNKLWWVTNSGTVIPVPPRFFYHVQQGEVGESLVSFYYEHDVIWKLQIFSEWTGRWVISYIQTLMSKTRTVLTDLDFTSSQSLNHKVLSMHDLYPVKLFLSHTLIMWLWHFSHTWMKPSPECIHTEELHSNIYILMNFSANCLSSTILHYTCHSDQNHPAGLSVIWWTSGESNLWFTWKSWLVVH